MYHPARPLQNPWWDATRRSVRRDSYARFAGWKTLYWFLCSHGSRRGLRSYACSGLDHDPAKPQSGRGAADPQPNSRGSAPAVFKSKTAASCRTPKAACGRATRLAQGL